MPFDNPNRLTKAERSAANKAAHAAARAEAERIRVAGKLAAEMTRLERIAAWYRERGLLPPVAALSAPEPVTTHGATAEPVAPRRPAKRRAAPVAADDVLTVRSLREAVRLASVAAERKPTVPMLSCVLLTIAGGGLAAECTTLEQYAHVTTAAQGHADFCAAVPVKPLLGMLAGDGAATVTLSADTIGEGDKAVARITLRIGDSEAALMGYLAKDFIRFSAHHPSNAGADFDMDGPTLAGMFERTGAYVSSEKTRYYLNGVALFAVPRDSSGLRAVATDGHRMCVTDRPMRDNRGGPVPATIMPRDALPMFAKLFSDAAVVRVQIGAHRVIFSAGERVLATKVIDGTFPKYQRVMAPETDTTVTFRSADLRAAVKQVRGVTRDKSAPVRLSIGADMVHVSASDSEAGTAHVKVKPVRCSCEGRDVAFQIRYVLDVLDTLGDEVTLHIQGASGPCRWADGDTGTHITMMPGRF